MYQCKKIPFWINRLLKINGQSQIENTNLKLQMERRQTKKLKNRKLNIIWFSLYKLYVYSLKRNQKHLVHVLYPISQYAPHKYAPSVSQVYPKCIRNTCQYNIWSVQIFEWVVSSRDSRLVRSKQFEICDPHEATLKLPQERRASFFITNLQTIILSK